MIAQWGIYGAHALSPHAGIGHDHMPYVRGCWQDYCADNPNNGAKLRDPSGRVRAINLDGQGAIHA